MIGTDGKIIPVEKQYKVTLKSGENIELGCVTGKVFKCLYTLLDLYFELKKSSFSLEDSTSIERTCQSVYAHIVILWELKQALLNDRKRYLVPYN